MRVIDSIRSPEWLSVTNEMLYFTTPRDSEGLYAIRVKNLATGETSTIAMLPRGLGSRLSVSPDGRTVLCVRGKIDGDRMLVEDFR